MKYLRSCWLPLFLTLIFMGTRLETLALPALNKQISPVVQKNSAMKVIPPNLKVIPARTFTKQVVSIKPSPSNQTGGNSKKPGVKVIPAKQNGAVKITPNSNLPGNVIANTVPKAVKPQIAVNGVSVKKPQIAPTKIPAKIPVKTPPKIPAKVAAKPSAKKPSLRETNNFPASFTTQIASGTPSTQLFGGRQVNKPPKKELASGTRTIVAGNPASVASALDDNLQDLEMPVPAELVKEEKEYKLNISGTKTFEMKKADVKGDVGHFSTENFDSIPGFHLDQSLHLEVDGKVSKSTTINAVLDDKEDEDRRFTVGVEGRMWKLVMGDFPLSLKDTEFTLHNKEVRGILAEGTLKERLNAIFLYSRSKGLARREQFRGAGQQQEFRLSGKPVVQNSEKVTIDGRLLARGTDYLIDYEDGVVKFQPQLLPIEVTSWIIVEYEVSDANLAFKRNLYGARISYLFPEKGRLSTTYLREGDEATPNPENNTSGTIRPMDHQIIGVDGEWKINQKFTLKGENSFSSYDPNTNSEATLQDQKINDSASRISLLGKTEKLDSEISRRRIGKNFKMVGREGGVTELGERGLVSDILKENGRFSYIFDEKWSMFAGLEKSKTNVSGDPTFSAIDFTDRKIGATWKYKPKSQVESRFENQLDRESKAIVLSDRDKKAGSLVWDHDFGKFYSQTKLEQTKYDDVVNISSGSKVLQAAVSLGSEIYKKFIWSVSASDITLNDDLVKDDARSTIRNYTLDLNFDPNRVFNARGIFQWRKEKDNLANFVQNDEIADSRIQYRPHPDLRTQLKFKVENTTKVVRDPSLDPTKYIRPPSLPIEKKDQEEIVGTFQNPVQKRTSNFSTNYRLGEKGETNFDWKMRDLKDRFTNQVISFNDRKSYEFRYTPAKKWRLSTEYENGVSRNLSPKNELRDSVKRLGVINEFREGYILDSKYEYRIEDDVYVTDNSKKTTSKSVDFQRIFSKKATLEMGVQRNEIEFKDPSKEWEKRIALVFTPSARSQKYKLFFTHKDIESKQSGTHMEGGLNFSQFIGTDSIIDGEIKRVKSTAGLNGNGYDATVANTKMIITF